VAAEVGCSPTAIYLYYESIEHVLHHLRLEGHALLAEYLRRPAATLDAPARLTAMQAEYLRFGREHPSYFALMFLARLPERPLRDVFRDESDTLAIVREAALAGAEAGTVRSDLDAGLIANEVWLLVHGLTAAIVSGHVAVTAPGREAELLRGVQEATRAWLRG
jgi:AcrR family transcriptional regulator